MRSRGRDSFVAGAASGVATRLLIAPLDVLKVRFQLQLEPVQKGGGVLVSKYRGLAQAVGTIVTEEGFTALWKGTSAGLLLYAVYGASQFGTFNAIKKLLVSSSSGQPKASVKTAIDFASGSAGGMAGCLVAHPLDVLRTRFIAQGEPKMYRSFIHAIIMMYRENRVWTFYRGLSPSLLSIAPLTGLYFTLYNAFASVWDTFMPHKFSNTTAKSLSCGAVAGTISKFTLLPLDLAKKRLEVQGFEEARHKFGRAGHYNGLVDCVVSVVRQEGMTGLYKGGYPALIKAGTGVALSFMIYEHVMKLLQS